MTRREILTRLAAVALLRCASAPDAVESGRLTVRPHPHSEQGGTGLFPLGLGTDRDGLLYVPRSGRLPLIVMLHGAGGAAQRVIQNYRSRADEFGFIILAPDSRGATWDLIHRAYGPDVRFVDNALARVFNRYDIDPRHLAMAGFSDGASYALSLGIINGDLFSHVMAFSPGFAAPASRHGAPRMFISHGSEDTVLPVENTRRLVRQLRSAGYDLRYDEFRGSHRTPAEIAGAAFAWFTASSSRPAHARM